MASKIASSIIALALAATSVDAHAFFHTGFVNGQSQGHLFGVRAPNSNSPIQDVTSSAITCNADLHSPVSTDVIEVAPGDEFGMQWNHNLDGLHQAGDADDPIASSHKGPVMVYMAKVADGAAGTNDGSGLEWFKVAEEGLNPTTGVWGVDTLIANAGLWSFTMPSLASGDYLLRGEIIALHSAGSTGQAQFYMSCAGIRVTGSGTCSPSDTVSFPGAYSASDPGILISIYGNTGKPDNGGKAYTIPGPSVATCDGSSSKPSSSSAVASTTTTSASVSVSASVTTAKNVASSSTTSASTSSSVAGTTTSLPYVISSTTESTTTTPRSALPTTLSTITSSRPANGTWTWTRPAHSTKSQSSSSLSSSSVAASSRTTAEAGGDHTGRPSVSASSTVEITASATVTGIKVPDSSSTTPASDDSGASSPTATGTSPATPSGSGYSMTGPGGKKFVCYEVTDF